MKVLASLLAAMSILLGVAVLAYADVIDLPGEWRVKLGLAESTPNPDCRPGLYRRSLASPKPVPGQWQFEPEAPKAQIESGGAAIGETIYVAGGARPGNLHTLLAFDTRSRRWSEPTKLPVGLNHAMVAAHGGKLYVAGGFLEGNEETDLFFSYDPATKEWSKLPPMKLARGGGAAVTIGKNLYVIGGGPNPYGVEEPKPPIPRLEVFDFRKQTWSVAAAPPVGVHHTGAAVVDGKIYLTGGRFGDEVSTAAFSSYDPARDRWTRLPDLPQGKISSLSTVTADGRVVVIGGDDEEGWEDGGGFVSPMAWAYDPRTREWTRLPDLHVERHAFTAATVGDRIYAITGTICPGLKPNGPVPTHTVESLAVSFAPGR
ncbi:MAG TPA: kelch repeat-containing protein [Solirubrobacterales bacterium]|nr:kelch repeat-containing protein [Solirubrobacterales bacterium]